MPDLLLTHANRADAVLSLLKLSPAGVTREQLQHYYYLNSRGKTVCLSWEARAAISEARQTYHIDHISLHGQSAWVLRGPKQEPSGQLRLALA